MIVERKQSSDVTMVITACALALVVLVPLCLFGSLFVGQIQRDLEC